MGELELWPHQSLTGLGFLWFIVPTVLLFLLPLGAVLGSPILWVLLFFFAGAVVAIWWAIMSNRRHRKIVEQLSIWPDRIVLRHTRAGDAPLLWDANPYWVELSMVEKGGPVDNYLTLRGNDRSVEIGAFLSSDERITLRRELEFALARARNAQ